MDARSRSPHHGYRDRARFEEPEGGPRPTDQSGIQVQVPRLAQRGPGSLYPLEGRARGRIGGAVDTVPTKDPSLLRAVVANGRPLLQFTAFALFFSGCFELFVSIRREFLPHDISFLEMTPEQLCAIAECRVVAFMFSRSRRLRRRARRHRYSLLLAVRGPAQRRGGVGVVDHRHEWRSRISQLLVL